MAKQEGLRLTKAQRDLVFNCRVGYGVAAYKSSDNTIISFEFFIDRQNRMCYISNGKPIEFEVSRDDEGLEVSAVIVEGQ